MNKQKNYLDRITYSGKAKIEICSRLNGSWKQLADYLEIPVQEQTQFIHGDEARGIWEWLEFRKRLQELPDALAYINRQDLVAFLQQLTQKKLTSNNLDSQSKNSGTLNEGFLSSSKSDYELVKESLIILTTFIREISQIKYSMFEIVADLNAIHEQIYFVNIYKKLHDLLYYFQSHCYYLIDDAYKTILKNELCNLDNSCNWDNLSIYVSDVQKVIDDMYKAIALKKLPIDESYWIKDFEEFVENLRQGIEESNITKVENFIWYADHKVLASHPNDINIRLISGVSNLRLDTLREKMVFLLSNDLKNSCLDQEKVARFNGGVDALGRLYQELTNLSQEHNTWQDIDRDLHRIEGSLVKDTAEVEKEWKFMKQRIDPLYLSPGLAYKIIPKKRRDNLIRNSKALSSAINLGVLEDIKKYFKQYRRLISFCFDDIDKNLMERCESLTKISDPLDAVIRLLI